MNKKIIIGYLYPEYMNIYGDTGNIVTLCKRASLREIDIEIKAITIDTPLNNNSVDIYFFGGGQDQQQVEVSKDIQRIKETLQEDVKNGAVALTICGGYQLFGKFYRPFNENDLPGIEIFPIETHASNVRMINNLIIKMEDSLYKEIEEIYSEQVHVPRTLVGFENHSGQTILSPDVTPLGDTLYGYGNNDSRKQEGCRVHNAFGTYMHGSLLPKNPHFADYLLYKALEYRYKEPIKLQKLNDELEYKAHEFIVHKYNHN